MHFEQFTPGRPVSWSISAKQIASGALSFPLCRSLVEDGRTDVKRLVKYFGVAVCMWAIFVLAGGHWIVLQTIAWSQMLANYAQTDSVPLALSKTFDGEHPCPMCMQIQDGRQQEQKERRTVPPTRQDSGCHPYYVGSVIVLPPVPSVSHEVVPFVPEWAPDLRLAPPTPPPRSLGRLPV